MSDIWIDYDSLLRFSKTLDGKTLRTNAGRAKYTVRLDNQTLYYTPLCIGKDRRAGCNTVKKAIVHFNNTSSLKLSEYGSITANSTYLTRLFKLMTEGKEKRHLQT